MAPACCSPRRGTGPGPRQAAAALLGGTSSRIRTRGVGSSVGGLRGPQPFAGWTCTIVGTPSWQEALNAVGRATSTVPEPTCKRAWIGPGGGDAHHEAQPSCRSVVVVRPSVAGSVLGPDAITAPVASRRSTPG